MDERVIIKSERYHIGIWLLIFAIVIVFPCAIMITRDFIRHLLDWNNTDNINLWIYIHGHYSSPIDYAWQLGNKTPVYIASCTGIICLLIYFWTRSYELIVTDKRAYGKAAFGKRVDLPLDMISAVGTGMFKSIAIATSSGKISFLTIKNRDDIHKCVSDLLLERQKKSEQVANNPAPSNADELKKYKELLDIGVISQEEFDAKKKQLLGV